MPLKVAYTSFFNIFVLCPYQKIRASHIKNNNLRGKIDLTAHKQLPQKAKYSQGQGSVFFYTKIKDLFVMNNSYSLLIFF